MNIRKVVTLGLPESGKTAYMSCAMLYMARHDKTWKMMSFNRTFLELMNHTEEIMRSGAWPEKTRTRNDLQFEVEGSIVNITDWAGEHFEALADYEAGRSFSDEMGQQFKTSLRKADYLLIFIDGATVKNENTIRRVKQSLIGFQLMLEEFRKEKVGEKRMAFIVTKSDELERTRFFCNNEGKVDDNLVTKFLIEKYETFFKYMKDVGKWLLCNVYSVSCIPNEQHRRVDLSLGTVATSEWQIEDMEGQVKLFKDIGKSDSSWGKAVLGLLVGSVSVIGIIAILLLL